MKVLLCLLFSLPFLSAEIRLVISDQGVGKGPAELDEVVVDAKIHGRFLIRDLKLVFENPGNRVAEGDLICPLEDGEQVVSFAMDVNGIRRDAVVVPSKKARYTYETIVARGVDPGLLEVDEIAKEFRARVYPIPAKGRKTVWIRLVRWISEKEVQVWPKGLGSPGRWELQVETKGGTAGNGNGLPRQEGGGDDPVKGGVVWHPAKDLAYRSRHGDLVVAEGREEKAGAAVVDVWMDGTVDPSKASLDRLHELLQKLAVEKVRLRIFREQVGEPQSFVPEEDRWEKLVRALAREERFGMARPANLPWQTVAADAVVLLTDGDFAFGRSDLGETRCPLHVIDSGEGRSRWLRSRAVSSGGGWHGNEGLDPAVSLGIPSTILAGEAVGQLFYLRKFGQAIETPIADWLWARLRLSDLKGRGVSRKTLNEFRLNHGVVDDESALIVLETSFQYREFGIEPPLTDQKLYREWESLKDSDPKKTAKFLDRLALRWRKRCDVLSLELDPVDRRLNAHASERAKQLERFWEKSPTERPAVLAPLLAKLGEVKAMTHDGLEPEVIPSMKVRLQELERLEERLRVTSPQIQVIIGGQIRRPGRLAVPAGTTLGGVIKMAGGETPFAAMRRVKLYRRGKVFEFDLRDNKAIRMQLFAGDVIELPQMSILSDGGWGGTGDDLNSTQSQGLIPFARGAKIPAKSYLRDLSSTLEDEKSFVRKYRRHRNKAGWRADFYLDVIELLRSERAEWALPVVADLAEHLPSNPDVLRKAALAARRLGENELCGELLERVIELNPESEVARYDLARSMQDLGQVDEAVKCYWELIQLAQDWSPKGRTIVALAEMNALIAKEGLNADDFGIPAKLIRHVPVQLRVVLECDANDPLLDLTVQKPYGSTNLGLEDPSAEGREWWTENEARFAGPRSWSARDLLPGHYQIGVVHPRQSNGGGPQKLTVEVEVIRFFGQADESRTRYSLRLEEGNDQDVIKVKAYPKEWE